MKYINANRLREELQRPKTELKVGNYYLDNSEQAVGYENALVDFELLIDSLQQEMWKPSEEQITAAKSVYSVLKSHDTWGEDEHLPILMSLINDLQKLLYP